MLDEVLDSLLLHEAPGVTRALEKAAAMEGPESARAHCMRCGHQSVDE